MNLLTNIDIEFAKMMNYNINEIYDEKGNYTKIYALIKIFVSITLAHKIIEIYKEIKASAK